MELENVNQNILNLIGAYKKTGQSDEVIKQCLFQLGAITEVVEAHLEYFNKNNKLKENNNMNLTLLRLCEQVSNTVDVLTGMRNDNRLGYSAYSAQGIIEQCMKQLPDAAGDVIEEKVNPVLKYTVAEGMYNALNAYDFLAPVHELRSVIAESFEADKWKYVAAKVANNVSTRTATPAFRTLYEGIANAMTTAEDFRGDLKKILKENLWSNDCKMVLSMIDVEEKEEQGKIADSVYENSNCVVRRNISPIVQQEDGYVFNLNGKNYLFDGKDLTECKVTDQRYLNVLEGLRLMQYDSENTTLKYNGKCGLVLNYNVENDNINVNEAMDFTGQGILDLSNSLRTSGLFNGDNYQDCNTLSKFFESKDMLTDVDICTTITPKQFAGVFVSIINLQESVKVNYVNIPQGLNEMKTYTNASDAVKGIKDFIHYDATNILEDRLVAEGKQQVIINKKRAEINENLTFLEGKKKEIEDVLAQVGENEQLKEALKLVEGEIRRFEKQLQESYFEAPADPEVLNAPISNDDLEKDGYVEVIVSVDCPNCGLAQGDKVSVVGAEYAQLADDAEIAARKEDGTECMVPKAALKVEI